MQVLGKAQVQGALQPYPHLEFGGLGKVGAALGVWREEGETLSTLCCSRFLITACTGNSFSEAKKKRGLRRKRRQGSRQGRQPTPNLRRLRGMLPWMKKKQRLINQQGLQLHCCFNLQSQKSEQGRIFR